MCFKPPCFLISVRRVSDTEAEIVVLSKRECRKGSWADNSGLILRTKYYSLRLLSLTGGLLEGWRFLLGSVAGRTDSVSHLGGLTSILE